MRKNCKVGSSFTCSTSHRHQHQDKEEWFELERREQSRRGTGAGATFDGWLQDRPETETKRAHQRVYTLLIDRKSRKLN